MWQLQLASVGHVVQTDPYQIPSVCSMQHRSQDASSYPAVKPGQNGKPLAGLGLAKETGREVEVISSLKQDFHLLKRISQIRRKKLWEGMRK